MWWPAGAILACQIILATGTDAKGASHVSSQGKVTSGSRSKVATVTARSPWKISANALSTVYDSVVADLKTQQKFQKEKDAYCDAQKEATKERIQETKSSSDILADDRVKLEAQVEALQGDVSNLNEKMASIRAEIDSAESERKRTEKQASDDAIATKKALITTDSSVLLGARRVLQQQLVNLDSTHQEELALMRQFGDEKREGMLKVEQELQAKHTEVLKRQTELAVIVRTINDNERTATRDAAYLESLTHECEVFEKNEKGLKKSRTRLRDLLKSTIDILQEKLNSAGTKKILMQDLTALVAPSTFLQVSNSNDVFREVRDKIQEMLQEMEEEMNKEKGKHEWCKEEAQKNDEDRQKFQQKASAAESAIQYLTDELKSLNSTHSFAQKMKMQNMKIVDRIKRELAALDGRFTNAISNVETALKVLTEVEDRTKQENSGNSVLIDLGEAKITQTSSGRILTYLQEAKAEAQKLNDLLDSAKTQTKATLDEVKVNSEKAMGARERDAQDIDSQRADINDQVIRAKADFKMAKTNLNDAIEYTETMKTECGPSSAIDTAKRRQESIEALGDALKVLNGEMVAP